MLLSALRYSISHLRYVLRRKREDFQYVLGGVLIKQKKEYLQYFLGGDHQGERANINCPRPILTLGTGVC